MVTMENFVKGSNLYVLYDNEQMPQALTTQRKHCSSCRLASYYNHSHSLIVEMNVHIFMVIAI